MSDKILGYVVAFLIGASLANATAVIAEKEIAVCDSFYTFLCEGEENAK